ncbi:hypothetical protein DP113_34020 (plasmid) [Brasilonema octagenarum UFV-E1]|uniref:Uncharacterized protein n=2 Tax=Brasilonema TaxID=383614 RepID=A0A856MQA7_9CYAN|nr:MULTISPECIES: hypothetical protein [Brasilonema]NMF62494.1 hypothetical protein [Brasilonema octagenarum UFV-OR1]QDL12749.1 hypothetical protein DP114_33910 [Brasilonema sennae CENA114]QDL19145.1 hypothetical protein DP113_34020 [Brasilonema octagenarum UFV-E1]
MSKCTTYYIQAQQIDQLVEYFGTTLEKLTPVDKLALRATLAYWLFHLEVADLSEYTLNHALEDTMQGYSEDCQVNLKKAIAILEGIGRGEAEGLIEALTDQLRWRNTGY